MISNGPVLPKVLVTIVGIPQIILWVIFPTYIIKYKYIFQRNLFFWPDYNTLCEPKNKKLLFMYPW